MMTRPKCRRCGGPLDLIQWEVDEPIRLSCNNRRSSSGDPVASPLQSDAGFQAEWDNLPGDDVARLDRELLETRQ